ncbi:hypothetical protein PM082_017848 [Marasmius tenuissimus]|nr:hypothetical protein PM082_017848 [Marasmius tenuissimus]
MSATQIPHTDIHIQNNHSSAAQQNVNHGHDQINSISELKVNAGPNVLENPAFLEWRGENLRILPCGNGACHTAERRSDRAGVLEGTCQKALHSIGRWEAGDRPICVVLGNAGVGKSSVAFSVAKRPSEKNKLLRSHFFTRTNNPKPNHSRCLMNAIVYGLAMKFPSIKKRIAKDPAILQDDIEEQLKELILKPLRRRPWWRLHWLQRLRSRRRPYMFLIDGLDECGDEKTQLNIITTILSISQSLPHPPLRFLIFSRPEFWICNQFNNSPLRELTEVIVLRASDADIKTYLVENLEAISTSTDYPHIQFPPKWPSGDDVDLLVRKASGQFACAKDMVEFVKLDHPLLQLDRLLGRAMEHPSTNSFCREMHDRYDVLMKSNRENDKVLLILAAVTDVPPPLEPSAECIELLLGCVRGEVQIFLRRMHSVLRIGESWTDPIVIEHESFSAYLLALKHWPDQRRLLVRKWLQALSVSRMGKYSDGQLYGLRTCHFFIQWIIFCTTLSQGLDQNILDEIEKLDLGALYLCRLVMELYERCSSPEPDQNPLRRSVTSWDEVFREFSSWLDSQREHIDHLDPTVVGRFREHPKCFHLSWSSDSPPKTLVRWIVLNATGCTWLTSIARRVDLEVRKWCKERKPNGESRFPLRLSDCVCHHAESASSEHRHYQAACLDALKEFVSEFCSTVSGVLTDKNNVTHARNIFMDVLDSKLLQHCDAHDPALFQQCQKLFSSAQGCTTFKPMTFDGAPRRRRKLIDWLQGCLGDHALEVLTIVRSLLPE